MAVGQFGAVGVGYGQKAHFVEAEVREVEQFGKVKKQFFGVYVGCGSQKQIGWSKSGVHGFVAVGSEFAESWQENKEAFCVARKEAFAEFVEKYGEQACKKCVKSAEGAEAWAVKNGWVK